MMKSLTSDQALIILFGVAVLLGQAASMVIWRCPEFNLLKCQAVPKGCRSYRMIYIRHGHLECPGCLICADPWGYKPWLPPAPPTSTKSSPVKSNTDKSKSSRQQRRKHRGKKKRGRRSKYKLRKRHWRLEV